MLPGRWKYCELRGRASQKNEPEETERAPSQPTVILISVTLNLLNCFELCRLVQENSISWIKELHKRLNGFT